MFRNILVPFDGSALAERSLPWALAISEKSGATIQLVQAHAPVTEHSDGASLPTVRQIDAKLREHERTQLEELASKMRAASTAKVTVSFVEGPVTDCLQEISAEKRIDLVVMTTHGRGPLSRFWLGSVADALVRRLSVPMLLIHAQEGATDLAARATIRRILIGLDGSSTAEHILAPALDLADLTKAEVTLLRVIEPFLVVPDYPFLGSGTAAYDPNIISELQSQARAYLEEVAARLCKGDRRIDTRVILYQPVAQAILDEARDFSLIAVATHGRAGLARFLLGSVADKVVRGASIPVLVQRPITSPKGNP
jgi:nucleotide-binding universal stress UspA family protein